MYALMTVPASCFSISTEVQGIGLLGKSDKDISATMVVENQLLFGEVDASTSTVSALFSKNGTGGPENRHRIYGFARSISMFCIYLAVGLAFRCEAIPANGQPPLSANPFSKLLTKGT